MRFNWFSAVIFVAALAHQMPLAAGQSSMCHPELQLRVNLCLAVFQVDLTSAVAAGQTTGAQLRHLCPEYFRTKDCMLYLVMQCNTTIQTQYNTTYRSITNFFDTVCTSYVVPASGMPTADPNCNMTAIYDLAMTCIAPVQHTITYNYPTTVWALNAFCQQYYSAWACAMGHIRPCSYAVTFFNKTMEDIKKQFDPYCGDPDEAEGAAYAWVTPVAIVVPTLIIVIVSVVVVLLYLHKKGMLWKSKTAKVKDSWPRTIKPPDRFMKGHGPPLSTSITVIIK